MLQHFNVEVFFSTETNSFLTKMFFKENNKQNLIREIESYIIPSIKYKKKLNHFKIKNKTNKSTYFLFYFRTKFY